MSLESLCTNAEETLNSKQLCELQRRLNDITPLLSEYYEVDVQIQELNPDNADLEMEFESMYYSAVSQAEDILKKYAVGDSGRRPDSPNSSAGSSPAGSGPAFRLPTISIPKYSGSSSEDWLEYYEVFKSLVADNISLTNIQKLHFLKASLHGDAAQVIKSLEFTASNYAVAWNALCERYNDPRMLIHNHFKAIVDLEPIGNECASKLRTINDVLFKHCAALKSLASETQLLEFMIIFMVSKKLDPNTFRDWETLRNSKGSDLPTLVQFKEFLKNTANLLETLESKHTKVVSERPAKGFSKSLTSNIQTCCYCKGSHTISGCNEFKKLSACSRIDRVKLLKLCLNCLGKGHFANQCKSKFTCFQCKGKHHTLIHEDKPLLKSRSEPQPEPSGDTTTPVDTTISAFCSNDMQALLPTATAKIISQNGQTHIVRLLLDSGSQSNFIRSDLCKRLNLERSDVNITVSRLGKAKSNVQSKCDVELHAVCTNYKLSISCLVLEEITGITPNHHVNRSAIKIPDNIPLSDPHFDQPGRIDILIGSSVFWKLLCVGQVRLGRNLPILQKTQFGWIVSGVVSSVTSHITQCNLNAVEDCNDSLSRFWQIEHYPIEKVPTVEENACEKHFMQTTKRTPEGRFVVSIPFREYPELLGDSLNIAEKRFLALERRLRTKPELATRYKNFMQEYEDLGHMSLINPDSSKIPYYLPHHGVLKEDSVMTKLRVVFNGSQETNNGQSLNALQMVGPTIQQDLFSILIRFRKHPIAIAADVEKMYRQVLIEPSQRCLQRILWRSSPVDPILHYNLNTVTYGTASASFLAIRCLTQLGHDCEDSSPEVTRAIKEDFYVDDFISGAETVLAARKLCDELGKALGAGCFNLRKWISNSQEALEGIPPSDIHPGVLEFGSQEPTRTLGLIWNFQSDCFMFTISIGPTTSVTKRIILSGVSQIFDRLGLVGPCVLGAKMLLQKLWLEHLAWDDHVPRETQVKWQDYCRELQGLNDLKVKRHILCDEPTDVQFHGFCDASLHGYGACIFLRSRDSDGNIKVHLLCSKSRVAPLKPLTIPRLELCAAVLLAKLSEQVLKALNLPISYYFYWSDSTIVLGWLKTNPNSLQTFVCNRVADIQQLTLHGSWRHVPTKCNPADLLSRGVSPQVLKESNLWWYGPPWLQEDVSSWPKSSLSHDKLPELKTVPQTLSANIVKDFLVDRYSSLTKLIRVTAFCMRFYKNCLCPVAERQFGSLHTDELQTTLYALIKLSQQESFPDELKTLQKGNCLRSSTLLSFNVFLDSQGMLRVGGRLHNSEYSYDKKFPLLMSGQHRISTLLVNQEHLRLLHAGPQLLLSHLRERYWIIGGRNLVRSVIHKCVRCFRFSPRLTTPIMGNLPSSRITPAPPFCTTGVDYGGPLFIKDRKGRGSKTTKCYLCLFVCFATKAVHLELVTDLTMEGFLMAFRRFVARRGKPLRIYSDNGTNFVGANSELKELGIFLKNHNSNIVDSATNEGVDWHFIPAHSPHFGGIWEAGIKSSKYHFKRVIGANVLTFEEMYTLLTQVESTLNYRPLAPLSSDPSDLQPLTPAHFLVGRPTTSLPDPDLTELNESRLSIFQKIQSFHQHLWKRWSKEYVSELQQRIKWRKTLSQLALGSLVLLKEDNLAPLQWKLGRVIQLYPGSDGISRVASVKTVNGIVKRSFSKLCPLPGCETST